MADQHTEKAQPLPPRRLHGRADLGATLSWEARLAEVRLQGLAEHVANRLLAHYVPRCCSCHRTYDAAHGGVSK